VPYVLDKLQSNLGKKFKYVEEDFDFTSKKTFSNQEINKLLNY